MSNDFMFLNFQASTQSIEGFIGQLLGYLQQLIDQISKVLTIPDLLSDISDFSLDTIRKLLPKIQDLMSSGTELKQIIDRYNSANQLTASYDFNQSDDHLYSNCSW